VAFQSVKSLIDVLSRQAGDVGSVEDGMLSAFSKSSKKSPLHSFTKIPGALL
jgi:hypothetical protein